MRTLTNPVNADTNAAARGRDTSAERAGEEAASINNSARRLASEKASDEAAELRTEGRTLRPFRTNFHE